MNLNHKNKDARKILNKVNACNLCSAYTNVGIDILHKEIALQYIKKLKIPVKIMFIAESPPKFGNGFFYNENQSSRFRDKIFRLINCSNLPKVKNIDEFNHKGYYLADSINCRWDKSFKKKLPIQVSKNCSIYLENQIRLIKPKYIVTLGNLANLSICLGNLKKIINNYRINIVNMSFPLTASNETDNDRIQKLNSIVI